MARPRKTSNDVSTFLDGHAGGVYPCNEFCNAGDHDLFSRDELHDAAGLGGDGRSKNGTAREFSHCSANRWLATSRLQSHGK